MRIFGSRITNVRDSLILRLGLSSFFPARLVARNWKGDPGNDNASAFEFIPDGDGDVDTDGEVDGEDDGVADGEADVDADGGADVDADGEADVDTDGEADVDADGEADVDADGEADVDAVTRKDRY